MLAVNPSPLRQNCIVIGNPEIRNMNLNNSARLNESCVSARSHVYIHIFIFVTDIFRGVSCRLREVFYGFFYHQYPGVAPSPRRTIDPAGVLPLNCMQTHTNLTRMCLTHTRKTSGKTWKNRVCVGCDFGIFSAYTSSAFTRVLYYCGR